MSENLTKEQFIRGWKGERGYGIVPFIEYGRNFLYHLVPRMNLNSLKESLDDLIGMSVADAIIYTYKYIDEYDETRASFKTYFTFLCKKMFYKAINENLKAEIPQKVRDFLLEEEDTENDPITIKVEEEALEYKNKTIQKVYDVYRGSLSPEERKIFDIEFGFNLTQEDAKQIQEALRRPHARKATAVVLSKLLGIKEEAARQKISRMKKTVRKTMDARFGITPFSYSYGTSISFLTNEGDTLSSEDIDALSFYDCVEILFNLAISRKELR